MESKKISVELDGEMGNEATERSFSYEVPVTNNSFIEIKVVDLFGHELLKNIQVVADKDAPVITVTGVEDGKLYNTDIIPAISAVTGSTKETTTAKLDGDDYDGKTAFSERKHELIVTSTNTAAKTSTYKINFTIDKTAPVITVAGVINEKLYNTNVTPVINVNEGTYTATLDGAGYAGAAVTTDGVHKLIVNAVDLAGNISATTTISFTIDKTAPVITVTGVEDAKAYNTNVTATFKADEGTAAATATLNGKEYKGEEITVDGKYVLIVTATDLAGNPSTKTINFTIDKIAPVITVTGVEDAKAYKTNVTPVIKVNEGTFTAALNSKEYKGEEITANGKYELIVTATDLAGNPSTKTINFTIEKPAPVIKAERLAGLTRIETSIAIAKEQYTDNKPDAIVLATANDFPDALAGSRLAYKYNAPLLLVNKSVSDSKSGLDYITTNLSKNKNVYILGGTGVISTEVSDYLTAQGYNVIRIAGKDRYETNQKIIDYLNPIKGTPLVLTTGEGFADSLSVSSVVDIKGYSLLLNGKDTLSTNASNYITNVQPTTVYVIGGTGVLSNNIETEIKKINGGINIVRLGGVDRYETSMMIAQHFNLTTDTIAVAIGTDFPDALSGSVLAARRNSSVLLIDNNDITKQKALINKQKIMNVIILGGEGVISKGIENSLIN
jgi:putative cell wall-binding protein